MTGYLRMGFWANKSPNGDLEFEKIGPHHFHTLCIHSSQIMQKTKINFSKKIARDYISTNTKNVSINFTVKINYVIENNSKIYSDCR